MARRNLFSLTPALQGATKDLTGNGGLAGVRSRPQYEVLPVAMLREDLKWFVRVVDPALIVSSTLSLRMDGPDPTLPDLIESISTHGQIVPALLRPRRSADGDRRFEIVYGRRRLAAVRALGMPLRALIQDLGDPEALIAQRLENSHRRGAQDLDL